MPAKKVAKKKTTVKKSATTKKTSKSKSNALPYRKSTVKTTKQAGVKKTVKKATVKSSTKKQNVAKKTSTKKPATKNVAKKSNVKKTVAKKSTVSKKPVAKKPGVKKSAASKKPVAKKSIKAKTVSAKKVTTKKPVSAVTPKAVETKAVKKVETTKRTLAKDNYRLPQTVWPDHYQITLQPDLESKTFTGNVEIDIRVLEPTNTITLNTKEIEIQKASVELANGGEEQEVKTIKYDKDKQFAILSFAKPLSVGNWKISSSFSGVLNEKLKGFYYSSWSDEAGNKHPLAVTQFESTDARRAFPCFDEPEFKATYDVALVVPKNLAALSNGRAIAEDFDPATGLKTVRFKKTMKMSTYLLAFLVGDFVSSKAVTANGIELRAWTVPGRENLTKFSLEVAAFTIDYFEKYFGVDYPAPDKCDLVAIPDFAAGAMENKDCITFRETALLVDEKTATHSELERVAEVVMHELAHMWFGDLVTMRWWNGLWLNEAFATFMEMKALDTYKPEWKVWDKFGLSRAAAFRVDSLKSTHPIECPVHRAEEAQELFDVISYQKGCSVLYQIEQFIGENVFQKGINYYLNKHSYGNTETHDLWDGLEWGCKNSGSETPVRKIMDNWVFTAGHPILTVSEGKDNNSLEIGQKLFRFLAPKTSNEIYQVPVTMKLVFADGEKKTEKFVLNKKNETIIYDKPIKYVVVNASGSGFYRVSYSPALVNKLLSSPKENLSVIERFNLVNDSWAATKAGFMTASNYLDMVKLFVDEDDVSVWQIITSSLNSLRFLTSGESRQEFKHFVKTLCKTKAKELGWTPGAHESSQTKQLRAVLIEALGMMAEDQETYEDAQKAFASWKTDKASIDSNLLPAIVNILAYHGDEKLYDEYLSISKHAKTPQETLRFLYALAQFRNPHLLDKTMTSCVNGDVRTQDAPFLFIMIANNEIAIPAAWKFLQKNWEAMIKAYPDTGVVRLCSSVIPTLDKENLEREAQQFFAKHKVKSGDMAISQALEMLRVNVLFRERETKNIARYLEVQK